MGSSNLKIDIRRKQIMQILRQNGKVYVTELSQVLSATPVTIRNDLSALESEGRLTRVSGGAVLAQANTVQGEKPEGIDRLWQKQTIAQAVADCLNEGDTLFLNSGSTTRIIARELARKQGLNVVTNSIDVATILGDAPGVCVILLGGEINARYGFTYGVDAQDQMDRYRADWAILSVDSIDGQNGITTFHPEEAIIDRLMIAGAKKTVIAADSSKIGRAGFSRVCDCSEGIRLITNADAPNADLQALSDAGVHITAV